MVSNPHNRHSRGKPAKGIAFESVLPLRDGCRTGGVRDLGRMVMTFFKSHHTCVGYALLVLGVCLAPNTL